ncbi:hydantoinase/oxoprolinase family protein [Desertibaculum subflavum]|uniref:hydantoinase/oxoprolinase family protein n=1 Tax=Desertibaculum subflavum TaxID=2268458 RepID=UPI000E6632A5
MQLQAPWRIGVDVGGTFTDLVLADAAGAVHVTKVPSTPADPAEGVVNALGAAAKQAGMALPELMAGTSLMIHGSTVATNTLLEGKGAKVGMLTTAGFRDSLEIRRGIREDQWDHRAPFPPVLVPRYLRLPVTGRLDRNGNELEPVSGRDVEAAAAVFKDEGVEAVALCLLHSYADPKHEVAAASALRQHMNGLPITLSSDVAPVIGEYERGSTAVLNAYVGPRVVPYLAGLNRKLRQLGLRHSLLLVQSNGGAVSVDHVQDRPVQLLLSGPAAGVGALNYYRQTAGTDDFVSMEIGGTSCDVALMSKGDVAVTDQILVGGYHAAIPAIEIHTVGAGGGTIAGVDGAGMLFAGPRGAGAVPGPACYGRGNAEPTVTDAQLVLGRLRPGPYAGGAVNLDDGLAREAIETKVARPLGLTIERAAAGIIRLLEQNLLHAVERMSIERGYDPRRFTLVAAGGAGPMHGAAVARALGSRRCYVPRLAGAFCALGMLNTDVRQDFLRVHFADLDRADRSALEDRFAALEREAGAAMDAEGFGGERARLVRSLDLRYLGQQYAIRIELASGFEPMAIRRRFEEEHDRMFGHIQPQGTIEVTALRLAAIGAVERLRPAAPPAAPPPRPVARRPVWQDEASGWVETPVFAGADLAPSHRLAGPLVVEELTTTVLAGPGDTLAVDASGNFDIAVGAA